MYNNNKTVRLRAIFFNLCEGKSEIFPSYCKLYPFFHCIQTISCHPKISDDANSLSWYITVRQRAILFNL